MAVYILWESDIHIDMVGGLFSQFVFRDFRSC